MLDDRLGRRRKGTTLTVSYPTVPSMVLQPEFFLLEQEQGAHDVATLRYTHRTSKWVELLKTGTPIAVTWRRDNRVGTFLGYVSSVSQETTAQNNQPFEVHCIGASFPLKNRESRVFKNTTFTQVAKKIATEHGLGYYGVESTLKFDQLVMTNQSYWQWLQEQAYRLGYAVTIMGATLIVMPLDKLIDFSMSTAAVLKFKDSKQPRAIDLYDRDIDSFVLLSGDHIESSEELRTVKQVSNVDPYTGKAIAKSASPNTEQKMRSKPSYTPISGAYSNRVAYGKEAAQAFAKGLVTQTKLNTFAEIFGQGDPRVVPYFAVNILNTSPLSDGYWVVKKVTHKIGRQGYYEMSAQIVTDGIGDTLSTPFRKTNAQAALAVDLDAVVIANLAKYSESARTTKLSTTSSSILETQQGFVELNSVWKGN